MSSLDSFILRLSELAKDKQRKASLVRLCEKLKKFPETPNPVDRFKDDHELLMEIFMSTAEFVKTSNVNQIVGSLKLFKLLVPYLEAAGHEQTTINLTFKYILTDMPTTKEEVIEDLLQLILTLCQCKALFTDSLQKLAFIKIQEFTQMKSLKIETKTVVEICLQKLFLFTIENNCESAGLIATYFNFSLSSDDNTIAFDERQLTKMNPLLIVNTVLNIISQLDDEKFSQVSSLLKTILKRKFQLQKFNDENNKFLSSCSYPEGLKIKNFSQTQVVYLYSLLATFRIKQPMLKQVLFV